MSKVVVITGAAGFVGKKLALKLNSNGYKVIALDIFDPEIHNVTFINLDINKNIADLQDKIPTGATFIHLAALSTDSQCKENPIRALNTNLTGTARVIELAQNRKAERFIFASSEWVYPESPGIDLQSEETAVSLEGLSSLYAMTKLMGENLVRSICEIPYITLRFGIVYGPRTKPGSAPESIAYKISQGEDVSIGSGDTARRFIYVDDLVDGISLTISNRSAKVNTIYNLSGDKLVSLNDISREVMNLLNKRVQVIEGGLTPSIRNPSPDKFNHDFNFKASTSLRSGLEACIATMK
jgi:nucleoside-diphosphate-sugar epimerase